MAEELPLGRREPTDWRHVEEYPYEPPATRTRLVAERTLLLPRLRDFYDQGREGACVGFSSSWLMSILNRRRYDARWLWNRAKVIDEWDDTNPGDDNGTSVRAAMDILRHEGHVAIRSGAPQPVARREGILTNRWARDVDGVRASISVGLPVVLGTNWYTNFDRPVQRERSWWIGDGDLGKVRGGHAVCIFRASDRRQAVGIVNSWGTRYPLVWLSYRVLERLLDEHAEAALVTDQP